MNQPSRRPRSPGAVRTGACWPVAELVIQVGPLHGHTPRDRGECGPSVVVRVVHLERGRCWGCSAGAGSATASPLPLCGDPEHVDFEPALALELSRDSAELMNDTPPEDERYRGRHMGPCLFFVFAHAFQMPCSPWCPPRFQTGRLRLYRAGVGTRRKVSDYIVILLSRACLGTTSDGGVFRSRSECGYHPGTESPTFADGPLGCYAMARTDASSES